MEPIVIEANSRENTGTSATNAMRREGLIPAVLYGGEDVVHIGVTDLNVRGLIYTNEFNYALIKVDGKEYKAFVKDLQVHPLTDKILHIDFLELIDGKQVITEIPLKLTGNPVGVRNGGALIQKTRKLKVKILPEFLVPYIEHDVSDLDIGKSTNVQELNFPGAEILELPLTPIARIPIPRALAATDAVVAEDEADAEEGGEEGAPAEEAPAES